MAEAEKVAYEQYNTEAQLRAEITAELNKKHRDELQQERSRTYDRARKDYDKTEARWHWFWRAIVAVVVGCLLAWGIWLIADGVNKSSIKDQAIKDWQVQCITNGGVLYKQLGATTNTDLTYCVVGKVVSTR